MVGIASNSNIIELHDLNLGHLIASGGMGHVFQAKMPGYMASIALKIVKKNQIE